MATILQKHIQIHFLVWKLVYFAASGTEINSQKGPIID